MIDETKKQKYFEYLGSLRAFSESLTLSDFMFEARPHLQRQFDELGPRDAIKILKEWEGTYPDEQT